MFLSLVVIVLEHFPKHQVENIPMFDWNKTETALNTQQHHTTQLEMVSCGLLVQFTPLSFYTGFTP